MTQRFQKTANDGTVCEKYLNRFLNKEKQTVAALSSLTRGREKTIRSLVPSSQNQLIKCRTNVKQQNFHSPDKQSQFQYNLRYSDDSALAEFAVKTMNPKQRSRSTTVDRDTWSQALKNQKSGDKISMFGNFDPLRTLHFLAKELQFQLQSVLPEDNTIQQMVADMQYALKRVPPEVASTVHLQQAIDSLPRTTTSKHNILKPEKFVHTVDCGIQTVPYKFCEDNDKLQQIMEEGTLKLENSCKHMEKLCTELKNEKTKLEKDLVEAKRNNIILHKRISELEIENNEILTPRIKELEDEKRKLEAQLKSIAVKLDNVTQHSFNDLKSQITELKSQKNGLEQECNNLKHQMKVCDLEREKFVAVLALRDSQINEIRAEMSQLQEVVNEQLIELHNNAFKNVPTPESNKEVTNIEKIEEKNKYAKSDATISSIEEQAYYTPHENTSFKDLQFTSNDVNVQNDPLLQKPFPNFTSKSLDKLESQTNIRMIFDDLKKTAYAVTDGAKEANRYN